MCKKWNLEYENLKKQVPFRGYNHNYENKQKTQWCTCYLSLHYCHSAINHKSDMEMVLGSGLCNITLKKCTCILSCLNTPSLHPHQSEARTNKYLGINWFRLISWTIISRWFSAIIINELCTCALNVIIWCSPVFWLCMRFYWWCSLGDLIIRSHFLSSLTPDAWDLRFGAALFHRDIVRWTQIGLA